MINTIHQKAANPDELTMYMIRANKKSPSNPAAIKRSRFLAAFDVLTQSEQDIRLIVSIRSLM